MIISTQRKGWKKCISSGRYLNMFNHYSQDHGDIIDSHLNVGEHEDHQLAEIFTSRVNQTKKRSNPKRTTFLNKLFLWLIANRRSQKVIQINSEAIISVRSAKRIILELEALGYVEIFQGFATQAGSRPLAVWLGVDAEAVEQELQTLRENNLKDS
mgnify:FL=1